MSSDDNQTGTAEVHDLGQQTSEECRVEAPPNTGGTAPTASDLPKRIRSWEAYLNPARIPVVKSLDLDQIGMEIQIQSDELVAAMTRFAFDEFGTILTRPELRAFQNLLHGMALLDRRTVFSTEQLLADSSLLEAINILLRMQEFENGLNLPAGKLLCELHKIALQHSLDTSGKDWPKSSNRLSALLSNHEENLLQLGIALKIGRVSGGNRYIKLTLNRDDRSSSSSHRSPQPAAARQATSDEADDGDDSIFASIARKEVTS